MAQSQNQEVPSCLVSLASIPTEIQSKFMDLNSCHFRFSMAFASYGLSWELVAICSVCRYLFLLDCSMPIFETASKALQDALLGVHRITRITKPHVHCFSDPRFGALSPTKLWVHPLNDHPPHTPHTPLNSLRSL